ncbi:MAG: hypothetical protein R3C14_40020 [Caldilineaceae bacterium]
MQENFSFVRFLRFIGLTLVILAAYIAQVVFQHHTIDSVLPMWLRDGAPWLIGMSHWLARDLHSLALLFTAIAALSFGLLTVPWSVSLRPPLSLPRAEGRPLVWRRSLAGWLVVLVALCVGGGACALHWSGSSETLPIRLAWASSVLLYLVGAAIFPYQRPVEQNSSLTVRRTRPEGSWHTLLPLLIFAALQYGWQLVETPLRVSPGVITLGLTANRLVQGDTAQLFTLLPATAEFTQPLLPLTTVTTAVGIQLTGDLLTGVRLAGLGAALLTIFATWLVGAELFRRSVVNNVVHTQIEDDGRWLALLAALFLIFNAAMLTYSRTPIFMESVAWGTLGCWALLRGFRTRDRLTFALSATLMGWSIILYPIGIAFIVAALLWWLGQGVALAGVLPHRLPETSARRTIVGAFVLWLLGLAIVTAPALFNWLLQPQQWLLTSGRLHPSRFWATALAVIEATTPIAPPTYPAQLFNALLAPLLVLGIGALLFNLDRRQGWVLFTWLGSGWLCAVLFASATPNWPGLLALLPAGALTITFGLERLRVTILRIAGLWVKQIVSYLLFGLILWVGLYNGAAYYEYAHMQADTPSAIGHALRQASSDTPIYVITSPMVADAEVALNAETPLIRFFTNDKAHTGALDLHFTSDLPDPLPPHSRVLLAPDQLPLVAQLQEQYPDGVLVTQRDHHANPLLYLFQAP